MVIISTLNIDKNERKINLQSLLHFFNFYSGWFLVMLLCIGLAMMPMLSLNKVLIKRNFYFIYLVYVKNTVLCLNPLLVTIPLVIN